MNKRIVLKTVLICIGIFIILISAGTFFMSQNYELDTEKRLQVLVASTDINEGDIVNESMAVYKTIKQSALNQYMITDAGTALGKKALSRIAAGDYITGYNLLAKEQWHGDNDKIIILPMDIEDRLANIIKKGSLIDIKVQFKDVKSIPQVVLSKVTVEDVLDENGLSLENLNNSKKAYAKVILDDEQRNRLYVAAQLGKLIYEAYCDRTQAPAGEIFRIPDEYLKMPVFSSSKIGAEPESNKQEGGQEE